MLKNSKWTEIWYKCSVCQRCFEFPERFITHRDQTKCGEVYRTEIYPARLKQIADAEIIEINSEEEKSNDTSLNTILDDNKLNQNEYLEKRQESSFNESRSPGLTSSKHTEILKWIDSTQSKVPGSEIKMYECGVCTSSFFQSKSLSDHIDRVHQSTDLENNILSSNPPTQQCFTLKESQQNKTSSSVLKPSVEQPKMLNSKSYKSNSNPQAQRKKSPCNLCGKWFTPSHLKEHMNRHQKIKNFKCLKCKTSYSRIYDLKRHMKTRLHNSQNTNFSNLNRLVKHDILGNSVKFPFYKCGECKKILKSPINLANHMKLYHDPSRLFQCKHCRKRYNCASNLKKHNYTHFKIPKG